ncbi:MAG: peptidoglycan-binding protein [Candidatus Paceibacterota bacterium]|jgi:peptidoglycan hydrolase-like protein with peptidoglycan-binding domain
MKKIRNVSAFVLFSVLAFGASTAFAVVGEGTATIDGGANVTVTQATSQVFTVVLTVGASGITADAENPTFTVPAGFTAPTSTPVATAGDVLVDGDWFVIGGGTCLVDSPSVGLTAATGQVITVDVTTACTVGPGGTITLTYKGKSDTEGVVPFDIGTNDVISNAPVQSISFAPNSATLPTITVTAPATSGPVWEENGTPNGVLDSGEYFFQTIQSAIDAGTTVSGDTINVAAGTYAENLSINTPVTLQSTAGAGSTIISGTGNVITIGSDNVTINGFTVTNGNTHGMGIYSVDHSNLTITNNIVTNIGNSGNDVMGRGIVIVSLVSPIDSINISNNQVNNITSGMRTGSASVSASGVAVGWSTGTGDITGLVLDGNTITGINADTSPWTSTTKGQGANGILINHASGKSGNTGRTVAPQITNNTINNLEGLWVHAIGLEGNTPDAVLSNNTISNLTSHKTPSDAFAIFFEDNAGMTTVSIDGVMYGATTTVAVSAGWSGLGANPLVSLNGASYIFGVNATSTIQAGINAVADGGTITVGAGTYNEKLSITKSVTLIGSGILVAQGAGVNAPTIDGVDSVNPATITINSDTTPITVVIRNLNIAHGGSGVDVLQNATVTVDKNTITGYYKNGITYGPNSLPGSGGVSGTVSNNIVTGSGLVAVAQNGIQISEGNTATISNNWVSNNLCNAVSCGADWYLTTQASGILLDGSAGTVTVSGNTVENNDMGIYNAPTSGASSMLNNVVRNNRYFGILFEMGGSNVMGGIISGNGVGVFNPLEHSSGAIVVNNIEITGNTTAGVQNDAATFVVNAVNNWWGTASSTEIAAKISGSGVINFDPYYTSAAMTTLSSGVATNATYTSTTAGEANLPTGITDVILTNTTAMDLSAGLVSGAVVLQSGTEGAPIVLTNSNLAGVSASIPDGTTITGPSGWNGILTPPVSEASSGTAPAGFTVGGTVISVGSAAGTLTFDKAVKIILAGVTGTVGYKPALSGNWVTITTQCVSANDSSNISSGECYFHDGGNTVIWTYHFTEFGGLDPIPAPTPTPVSSGGGGGGIVGSGSGAYGVVNTNNYPGLATAQQVAAAVSAVPTAQPVGQVLGATTYRFGLALRLGSRGDEVTELQNRLVSEGVYSGPVTGYFGSLTSQAVKAFQAKYGIAQAGTVGPQTREKLNSAAGVAIPGCTGDNKFSTTTGKSCVASATMGAAVSAFVRSLQHGSTGDDVTKLQERLTAEGVYSGPITGYFGNLTSEGVKKFQEKNGLEQAGVVGPKTRELLNK